MNLSRNWLDRLLALQRAIRVELRESMARQDLERMARRVRDDAGDTIFGIDVDAETVLLRHCERWARDDSFVVVAEGLPAAGQTWGSDPSVRIIVDPIDGTRGLMFDKRSAWSLAAVAPERGEDTSLASIELAVMCELPTTRQVVVEDLCAVRGRGATRTRVDVGSGSTVKLPLTPSRAVTLRHGFATVCNFFQGGKELTSRIEEDFLRRALDGWIDGKAEVYADQYISSGGQLAELALGRDRFVADIRPLVHRALGHEETLCCRPYDLCTALVATEAGCVVTDPFGQPVDGPLDTTTNLAFVGYANPELAERLGPLLVATLAEHGITPSGPG